VANLNSYGKNKETKDVKLIKINKTPNHQPNPICSDLCNSLGVEERKMKVTKYWEALSSLEGLLGLFRFQSRRVLGY
jgi:hypothetical protein